MVLFYYELLKSFISILWHTFLTLITLNSNTKSITIKASTRDQQWCDLEKGCIITKESDTIYHNSYPGDYTSNQINGEITAVINLQKKI